MLISARDARLLAKDMSLDPGEEKGKLRGGYTGAKTRPTGTLTPGERVGSLEVIASPGHTPGHVALLDTRDRTVYCGDTFSTLGGVATSAKPNPRFPLPALATWHRPTVIESARALRALNPARLAPGHGAIVEDPGARDGRRDREGSVAQGLVGDPLAVADLVVALGAAADVEHVAARAAVDRRPGPSGS